MLFAGEDTKAVAEVMIRHQQYPDLVTRPSARVFGHVADAFNIEESMRRTAVFFSAIHGKACHA
jgi:hypothetical protein